MFQWQVFHLNIVSDWPAWRTQEDHQTKYLIFLLVPIHDTNLTHKTHQMFCHIVAKYWSSDRAKVTKNPKNILRYCGIKIGLSNNAMLPLHVLIFEQLPFLELATNETHTGVIVCNYAPNLLCNILPPQKLRMHCFAWNYRTFDKTKKNLANVDLFALRFKKTIRIQTQCEHTIEHFLYLVTACELSTTR